MILIDTSVYIGAAEDSSIEKLLEDISEKFFVQSCDIVEREINSSSEFLRRTDRKEESEKLKLIYEKIRKGTIRTSERISNLAQEYHKEAGRLSKQQHKDIKNDFLIVASASVAGVKKVLSFNRKTMAAGSMVAVYQLVNGRYNYKTPAFLTTKEGLSVLLLQLL
ncbi:MAG: PIN domain-containing protein [Candidatus Aenigmarchaeota archaeon]|nr:PIN domain-containing protein [Candidatus Aenigmarchaeota archaeon]